MVLSRTNQNFADFTCLQALSIFVSDFCFGKRKRLSFGRNSSIVNRARDAKTGRFCQAIPFDDFYVEPIFKQSPKLFRRGGESGNDPRDDMDVYSFRLYI